jgi:hypothetical protein
MRSDDIDYTGRQLAGYYVVSRVPKATPGPTHWNYRHACGHEGQILGSAFSRTPKHCPGCMPKTARGRTGFIGHYVNKLKPPTKEEK